ncbi:DUF7680 family protein [Methylomicrobium album]|uniref:DUF7680 domain-containing protein n=1 Tax=Methylomicrobium album BG8 TaxID=686340 RepID=H8GPL1_METAL|nr:hypothetical protein [Methylomicrobium album]EIC28473.1 hypothetical protein Metal_0628 [Methylomicrobium album BG8]
MSKKTKLSESYDKTLKNLWRTAPFVLRITELAEYPGVVLVVKERVDKETGAKGKMLGCLQDRGALYGENLKILQPRIKAILESVVDEGGVPLELQRFISQEGLKLRDNLPLDEEAGAKLALIFKLQSRLHNPDRLELLARRVQRFSREEAAYWLGRTTHYGADANRWAEAGLRTMLCGTTNNDAGIERLLNKLR